jgi:hypothetical protein
MKEFYERDELDFYHKIHSTSGFVPETLLKASKGVLFYAGFVLLPPLIMLHRVLLDRRIRFLVVCLLVLAAGQLTEIFFFPHYLAPFTAAFYAIGLQAMRHLRLWTLGDQPVGVTMVRLTVALCVFLAGVGLFAEPLHLNLPVWPVTWAFEWYGPNNCSGQARRRVEAGLEPLLGKQLVIVRYAPGHDPMNEWVYNAADIDDSKVVWAREMDEAGNLELIHYYKDRTVWLVQPDSNPASVSLYPLPNQHPLNASR